MFTGLVQQTGRLEQVSFQGEAGRLRVAAAFSSPLEIGESIAVNGACLTLVESGADHLVFDILRETFEKTALRGKAPGAKLNLERALRMGDSIGGHLVSGHVDQTGEIQRLESTGRDHVLVIATPELISEIIPKGSIAIDGVSLTVVDVTPESGTFSVHIIPHTWNGTALSSLSAGMPVNLETELIGKYVRAQAQTQPEGKPPLTWDNLREAGFLS
jgi:riboflavin synthase